MTKKQEQKVETPEQRDETPVNRNLKFPKYVWDALDEEAARRNRSAAMQLLTLLQAYYELDNTESVSAIGLEKMRAVPATGGSSANLPAIPQTTGKQIVGTPYMPTKKKGGRR